MGRTICLGELSLGIEGAALFRHLVDCDQAFPDARVDALRGLLARYDDPRVSFGIEVPELDVETGYTACSTSRARSGRADGSSSPTCTRRSP